MNYNTVLFDLDGTLLNTLDDLTDSVNYALKQMDFPIHSSENICSFVGNGVRMLIERAVPKNTAIELTNKCFELFKTHYADNMENKTGPYNGVLNMLKKLYENNIKIAIVSNKYDDAVKNLNTKLFSDYVKVAIGESKTVRPKPAPDSVFEALKQLNSSADAALYVGDSDVDINTAKNAGIRFIGISWGFRDKAFLLENGAKDIIDNPEEIFTFIQN